MFSSKRNIFKFYLGPVLLGFASSFAHGQQQPDEKSSTAIHEKGRAVYNYYCYQCHGYAGDANTLASSFLDPRPRDFSATPLNQLARQQMISILQQGREGTAMVSFSSVLNNEEVNAVVDYVRTEFMSGNKPKLRYHTPENGWENHNRYAAAFPFANGELALDSAWEDLTLKQQEGKRLFMTACISCHDRARVEDEGNIWDLRPLSYPRKHYTHTQPMDSISGASPYAVHDQVPPAEGLSDIARQGESLFQVNCAFCHAADGTGRNWIGSFLEPHPRDLTTNEILQRDRSVLRRIVLEGLPATSMPAWKHVLSEAEVDAIFEYLRQVNRDPVKQKAKQLSTQTNSLTPGPSGR